MSDNAKITKYTGFSILLIAFVWIFETSAVSPILGALTQEFPNETNFKIQLVSTMPFLTSIIFSIVAGVLAKRYDKKKLVIFGLLIYGVTGMLPAFAHTINQILLLRLITGIGVGFVLPLPNIMITEHYDGKQRERMLGLATSVANIANVINSVLIGCLLMIGWRSCFLAFILVLVIMVNCIFGLPKSPPLKQDAENVQANLTKPMKKNIPFIAYILGLCMVLIWALFQFNILNMAVFIMKNHLGAPWMIGLAIAIPGFGSIFSGAVFPEFYKKFGKYFVFTALLIFAIGFMILFNVHSFGMLMLANIIIGFGQGLLVPYLLNLTSHKVTAEQREVSFGLVSGCIHVGIFASPFLQAGIAMLFSNDSVRFLYQSSAIALGIATVIALIYGLRVKSNGNENIEAATSKEKG